LKFWPQSLPIRDKKAFPVHPCVPCGEKVLNHRGHRETQGATHRQESWQHQRKQARGQCRRPGRQSSPQGGSNGTRFLRLAERTLSCAPQASHGTQSTVKIKARFAPSTFHR